MSRQQQAAELCTPHAAADTTLSVIKELQDLALDPTLEDCCRRDVQQQINAERVRHTLQMGDRVDARQRMAAAAIRTDSSAAAAAAGGSSSSQVDSRAPEQQQPHQQHEHLLEQQQQQQQPDDGDEEAQLQRLRQQRLRQLQAESGVQQEQRRAGFGVLNTVPESSVMKLCTQDPPGRGLVVLHLAVQGYEPCNTLDECLEEAAVQYRGTYFARCVVSRNSPLIGQLQLPHGAPALLVAKHCAVLGKAHINQFGGADIWDEEVMSYLQRFKVLSTGTAASSIGGRPGAAGHRLGSSEADSDDCSDDEAAGDWQAPCEVCGRTYPHEHIRSIYSSQQPGSSDEEED